MNDFRERAAWQHRPSDVDPTEMYPHATLLTDGRLDRFRFGKWSIVRIAVMIAAMLICLHEAGCF